MARKIAACEKLLAEWDEKIARYTSEPATKQCYEERQGRQRRLEVLMACATALRKALED